MSKFTVRTHVLAVVTLLSALLGGVVLLATAPARAAVVTPSATIARAMWVWDTSTPRATVQLAVDHGIGQLYVAVPPHVDTSAQLPQLRDLAARAKRAGIRVDALGGDPTWVDNQGWVVDSWLRPALSTGLFSGVHVDIEPYTTAAWTTSQSTVVTKWLATLDALRQAAGTAPLEADIPFWLDQVAVNGSTLDAQIIARTSGVTVMAYRNTADGPDGTIALATHAVLAGARAGRPVRIGVETDRLGTDPTDVKQTFYGFTRTAMEAQLAKVAAAFSGSSAYTGFAIQDATGYAAMAP